jgi:hypothetical protein
MMNFKVRPDMPRLMIIVWLALSVIGCVGSGSSSPSPVAVQGAPIDSKPAAPEQIPGLKVAPTDPEARAALAVDVPAPSGRDGYISMSFVQLSDFPYNTDEDGKLMPGSVLPKHIEELNGKDVAVSGYVVPIEFKEEKVSGLILVRNQLLCCYGEEPKLNEWVFVEADPPVEMITDIPVTLFGKFEASPDEEEGMVISLYRMKAVEMETMDS